MQLYRVYGFLRVQKTFCMHSMLLLGGLGHAPRKILNIEFGSNFDYNVTLVLKAICTVTYIIYTVYMIKSS